MTKQQILLKKKHGDFAQVGEMLGISANYAQKLIEREGAKRHMEAMAALMVVIESREHIKKIVFDKSQMQEMIQN